MDDLDAINRELAEIVDALNAAADDDFAARYDLKVRQDELRAAAAAFRVDIDEERPTEDLEKELAARRSQLDAIIADPLDLVTQAGGTGGLTGGVFTSAGEAGINEAIRDAGGAPEVRARIARLEELLATRVGA